MRNHTIVSLLATALGCALPAQVVVSPVHFTKAAGNSNGYAGVGNYASTSRHLQVHDDLAGAARTIHGIAFRRETPSNSSTVAANTLICDLVLSTAATGASAPNATFDANHGADKATLASFQFYQLPASAPAGASMPFEYSLPLPTPFAFGGQGGLAWEIRVHSSNTGGGILLDACSGTGTNPLPAVATLGTGCKATGDTLPITLAGSSSASWSQGTITASYTGSHLPKGSLVSLVLGTSTTIWAPLPLPFVLPGSNVSPSGACTVYCDWLALVPAATDATGKMTTSLGGPVNTGNHGGSIYAQVVALDAAANNMGLVTSNLVEHQVVAPFAAVPVGQVAVTGSHAATGTASARRGAIVRFD
jgi:hypothetical protein